MLTNHNKLFVSLSFSFPSFSWYDCTYSNSQHKLFPTVISLFLFFWSLKGPEHRYLGWSISFHYWGKSMSPCSLLLVFVPSCCSLDYYHGYCKEEIQNEENCLIICKKGKCAWLLTACDFLKQITVLISVFFLLFPACEHNRPPSGLNFSWWF